jgi:hypothetical protein
MICMSCGEAVADHETRCHVCHEPVGYPNVRKASESSETDALDLRVIDAFVSARARHCEAVLVDFGNAIKDSVAVISRQLAPIKSLLDSENQLMASFYGQVTGGTRIPQHNRFDRGRPSVDGLLFPHYQQHILFGALSLDGVGVGGSYGAYHLVLKDAAIAKRATVFEENSFLFCSAKHRITAGTEIPPGYRASWSDRHKLAQAKHHADLTTTTTAANFRGILLKPAAKIEDEVFIEVHIYGEIHRAAVQELIGQKPLRGPDLVLWNSLKKTLKKLGIKVTETP